MSEANSKALNDNLLFVINQVLDNQNLLKILHYESKESNPLDRPDLDNPASLVMKNIFPLPIDPDVEDTEKILLTINLFSKPVSDPNEVDFRDTFLVFEMICHVDNWLADGLGARTYAMAAELESMYNQKRIEELSAVRIKSLGLSKPEKFATNFYGQVLAFRLAQKGSDRGCAGND